MSIRIFRSVSFLLSGILCVLFPAFCQDKIYVNDIADKSVDQALIILPGFGDSGKGRKAQIEFFKDRGYDVYIPEYSDKKSYQNCISNFEAFYRKHDLESYASLYFFTYILGSWVLNEFLLQNEVGNIEVIVYDRSPLQERAPAVAHGTIPFLTRLFKGKVVGQMSRVPYPVLPKGNFRVGLVIESKATPLIRKFKKQTLELGEVQWSPDSLKQSYDDYAYTRLNHDEMYLRFDVVGDEILHFIENGRFKDEARREQFDWDPFTKYVEK